MKYRLFGRSGLRVSEICLGTMTFGTERGVGADKEGSRAMFDAFVEAGGNFFDTANTYTEGSAERFLGEFLGPNRDRYVVATKYSNTTDSSDPNAGGNHRKSLVRALESSLKRLRLDYVDILWIHAWDYTTAIDEVMRALDDLVSSGKILHIGASDTPAWVVSHANALANFRNWSPFTGVQIEYSLAERTAESELLKMADILDLAVTAWSPLAGGILTGKYSATKPTGLLDGDKRLDTFKWLQQLDDRKLAIANSVNMIANELGRKPAQIALNWLRNRGVIPIVGARRVDQLLDNLACLAFEIPTELLDRLDRETAPEPVFPHSYLDSATGIRSLFGETRDKLLLP